MIFTTNSSLLSFVKRVAANLRIGVLDFSNYSTKINPTDPTLIRITQAIQSIEVYWDLLFLLRIWLIQTPIKFEKLREGIIIHTPKKNFVLSLQIQIGKLSSGFLKRTHKFEKIYRLFCHYWVNVKTSGRFFLILWPS